MDEKAKEDRVITLVAVALVVLVFVLDAVTPIGIAAWILYALPLGLASWSSHRHLPVIIAGACTVLLMVTYFVSPPGVSFEFDVVNRGLGLIMLWTMAFFLLYPRA
jgi:hypothetical protein